MRADMQPLGTVLQSSRRKRFRGNLPARSAVCLVVAAVTGCSPPQEASSYGCDADARLATSLHGAVDLELDWSPDVLTCQGMPRPDGGGARLRFSGPSGDAPDASTVAFILGIPGLEAGQSANELGTNVTFMEEGTGRFFGTRDTDGCWSDINYQEAIDASGGSTYRIGGTVYCVSPLAELNGGSSISFTELEFAGRLNWKEPE